MSGGDLHPQRRANPKARPVYVGDKRLKALQKLAWESGWWPQEKKNGILWKAPKGPGQVMIHRSNSDHHAYNNLVGEFRKHGLDV